MSSENFPPLPATLDFYMAEKLNGGVHEPLTLVAGETCEWRSDTAEHCPLAAGWALVFDSFEKYGFHSACGMHVDPVSIAHYAIDERPLLLVPTPRPALACGMRDACVVCGAKADNEVRINKRGLRAESASAYACAAHTSHVRDVLMKWLRGRDVKSPVFV